jgi:hypothetical protein
VRRPPQLTALVAGLGLVALGVLLELQASGTLTLRFAYLGPVVVVVLGATLLASGLKGRDRG